MSIANRIERVDDRLEYFRHDVNHRTDGPAYLDTHGNMFWMQYGRYHRLDGPSDIYHDGTTAYSVNGKYCYSREDYESKIPSSV